MTRNSVSLIAVVFVAAMACRAADFNKMRPEVSFNNDQDEIRVIVQYKTVHDPAAARERVKMSGGHHHLSLDAIHADSFRVNRETLNAISDLDEVEMIYADSEVHATDFNGMVDYGWMRVTGLINKDANLAYTGKGIGIGIIDSGVYPDYEFSANQTAYNFASDSPGKAVDPYGHGTHVASIAAGNGYFSNGSKYTYRIRGIAPDVSDIYDFRVLNAQGTGNDSGIIAAITKAIQLKQQGKNLRVINLSLGRPVTASYLNDPLCQAVEAAWKAGIVVVVAAGNQGRNNTGGTYGYGLITAPGNDPHVITVGAMNTMGTLGTSDDKMATYSSKGPTLVDHVVKPDLVAPGNAICAAWGYWAALQVNFPTNVVPDQAYGSTTGTGQSTDYYQLSGTSMAAPMVTGAVAVLLQQNPNLTPDQVKARLMKTAWKGLPASAVSTDPTTGISYTTTNDVFTVGAGVLDLAAALASTDAATGVATSPTVSFNPTTKVVTLNLAGGAPAGTSVTWGSSVTWGASVIWGTSVSSATSVIWGTSVPFGTSSSTGTSVIWGSSVSAAMSVIWGTSTTEAMSIIGNGDRNY